jgi:hypothetical protein
VRLPDGSVSEVPAEVTHFPGTIAPGIYEQTRPEPARQFAVNLEGAESRTGLLPVENLEALGTPMRSATAVTERRPERKLQLAAIEAESRQKMWRWLIVAALGMLIIESLLAGRQSRRLVGGKETAV